jgi:hypothetical protein
MGGHLESIEKLEGSYSPVVWIGFISQLLAQDPGSTGVSVTTWQNDTHRTGRNLGESVLVSPLTGFGQLCNVQLDGQVYAQPLVETSVTIGGTHYAGGVAYVVTQNDTLYAIEWCSQLDDVLGHSISASAADSEYCDRTYQYGGGVRRYWRRRLCHD